MITFPLDHFDLWFRHYLRVRRFTFSEYAQHVGCDARTIEGVAAGELAPTSKILDEMQITIRSTVVEKCIWNWQREIDEL